MKPVKQVVDPTEAEKISYMPLPGESDLTRDTRACVFAWMRENPGPHSPTEITRKLGKNAYDEAKRVQRACASLWVTGKARKIVLDGDGGRRRVQYYLAR